MPAAAHSQPTPRIDRFDVKKVLGRGAQGTVYLATDTRLQRSVALKTLNADNASSRQLTEARMVGGLQHPNIVTLFDAGQTDQLSFLVFEYIDGPTVADLIRHQKTLPLHIAVNLAIGILRGIGYAHEHQTLHCDLKPSNILVAGDGTPRVMDFGVAQKKDRAKQKSMTFTGTPCYMAPETADGRPCTVASDLFSVGIVLYEMLVGSPPVVGQNVFETVHRMAQEPFEPPITHNPDIGPVLNQIIMRAIDKRPENRYQSAADMIKALENYLTPPEAESDDNDKAGTATLEFICQRMRFKSDFPALSEAVSAINRVASSEKEPVSKLTDVILKDIALTNKLLRIVNAAHYKQFGGSINTISRAVAILGFDAVRSAALSLVLFEHLQNQSQATRLRDIAGTCFFSSVLGRELANTLNLRNAEEIAICSMFHRLGKLSATFYLSDEAEQIARLAHSPNMNEDRAAISVMGMTYAQLGVGLAKKWNFPQEIIASMAPCTDEPVSSSQYSSECYRVLSNCANELADLTGQAEGKERTAQLNQVLGKYAKSLGLTHEQIGKALDAAAQRFDNEAANIGLKCRTGRISGAAGTLAANARGDKLPAFDADKTVKLPTSPLATADQGPATLPGEIPTAGLPAQNDRRALLMAGIQDITNTLAGSHDVSQALRIILETIYRGGAFDRVLLFARNASGTALNCSLGFGRDADRLIREGLSISLDPTRDIFFGALSRGADVSIQDINAEKVTQYIPSWYRKRLVARSLILLPMMVKGKAIGLIYADNESCMPAIPEEDLRLLRTLRSQAVMAVRQQD